MRALEVLREELMANFDGPALAGRILTAPLPIGVGNRVRVRILRASGMRLGDGTTVAGPFTVTGGRRASSRLHIGERCYLNVGALFDASAPIEIGDDVSLGQDVIMTTSGHAAAHPGHRAGELRPMPIRVGRGAWIAARAVLLPGVTVGEGAIITAGAVVNRSIPPHTMAGGVPARPIKDLDAPGSRADESPTSPRPS